MISDYTRAKIQVPLALGLLAVAFAWQAAGSRTYDSLQASGTETRARVSEAQYVAESGAGKRYGIRPGGYLASYYFVVDGVKHTGEWFYKSGSPTGGALKGKVGGGPAFIQIRYAPDEPSRNMPTIAPGRWLDYNRDRYAGPGGPQLGWLLWMVGGLGTLYSIQFLVRERAREASRLERKRLSQAERAKRLDEESGQTLPEESTANRSLQTPHEAGLAGPGDSRLTLAEARRDELLVSPQRLSEAPRVSSPRPQFGPYTTLGVLGQGGMGTVYLARHPDLGDEVAIKTLVQGRGATDVQRKRFQREVRALGQLQHPGLVEVLDAGEENGVPWFAMRRVAGGSLEERLRRGPLSVAEVIELGIQLCDALSVAHGQGILHRDLKPDNVLCTPEGRYVVTDFGLTKDIASAESVRLSQTGALQGTPGYWAPEQAGGRGKEATFATDVYGVGATLYAALTGIPPITGESMFELSIATLERAPVPPSTLATVPARLERVVLRCLAKSPEDRFASMDLLAEALSRRPRF
ncbi:MAG: serine/threonine protein kinase [Planctomycetes bacterium]|nr:serine/threonine protein kinase [Planctomycetota bacterium]